MNVQDSHRSLAFRCTTALGILIIACTAMLSAQITFWESHASINREHRSAAIEQMSAQLAEMIKRSSPK